MAENYLETCVFSMISCVAKGAQIRPSERFALFKRNGRPSRRRIRLDVRRIKLVAEWRKLGVWQAK